MYAYFSYLGINTYIIYRRSIMESIISLFTGDSIATYVAWATAIVTAASAIAAVTPTPKDDVWAAKAYKILDWFALNVGKAKDKSDDKTPPVV